MVLLVLLSACGAPAERAEPAVSRATPTHGASDPRLDGTRWRLTELNGREPLPRSGITLEFDRWRMLEESGCNTYGADFVARGGRLTLGEGSRGLLTTAIACVPRARSIQETTYLMALGSATGYRRAGDRLELTNEDGETILVFERIPAPPDGPAARGTPVR